MLTFKQFLLEMKPIRKFYHLGPADLPRGEDLKSMHRQHNGNAETANKQFRQRWPELDDLANVHSKKVWLKSDPHEWNHGHEKSSKEQTYYEIWWGKKMNPVQKSGREYPAVDDHIPARYIRRKFNAKTGKWEKWN